ncbi:MAG TPA: transposase [Gallionella sp.]|nr:transposase [Gallionella sp.]
MPYNALLKGRFSEPGRAYFVTVALDKREHRYFADWHCGRCIVAEMRALHEDAVVNSLAWVVMPDHVHWLFEMRDKMALSAIVKRFKARSARRVNDYLKRGGTLWQKGFYDHAIRQEDDIRDIARYIVANPLRAGLVKHIGDYPLWDAVWV